MTTEMFFFADHKQGGAGNDGSFENVQRIVKYINALPLEVHPLYVFSALGKTTKRLRDAYDAMLSAGNNFTKRRIARGLLDSIFSDHHNYAIGLLTKFDGVFRDEAHHAFHERATPEFTCVREALQSLRKEAHDHFDTLAISGGKDPHNKIKAVIESMGERLAVTVVMAPILRALGYRVIYLPALAFMRAKRSVSGNNTDAVLDWQVSNDLLRLYLAKLTPTDSLIMTTSKSVSGDNHCRTIVLMGGFIGRNTDDEIVTLGSDNSDQSIVFITRARRTIAGHNLNTTVTATMWKVLDPTKPLSDGSLEDLERLQQAVGTTLVSPRAIRDAQEHNVAIRVMDLVSGEGYIYTPLTFEDAR